MLRSGFLLGLAGPAIALTILVLPSVRASADRLALPQLPPVQTLDIKPAFVPAYAAGARMMSFDVNVFQGTVEQIATMPRPETRTPRTEPASTGPTASEKDLKPRRLTREGCETPLSSLVGPEARRMVPGRCMA